MTERQFTPEYIEFMQSDEAKALQGLWEPAVGDWVACGDGSLALVVGTALVGQYPVMLMDDEGNDRGGNQGRRAAHG